MKLLSIKKLLLMLALATSVLFLVSCEDSPSDNVEVFAHSSVSVGILGNSDSGDPEEGWLESISDIDLDTWEEQDKDPVPVDPTEKKTECVFKSYNLDQSINIYFDVVRNKNLPASITPSKLTLMEVYTEYTPTNIVGPLVLPARSSGPTHLIIEPPTSTEGEAERIRYRLVLLDKDSIFAILDSGRIQQYHVKFILKIRENNTGIERNYVLRHTIYAGDFRTEDECAS